MADKWWQRCPLASHGHWRQYHLPVGLFTRYGRLARHFQAALSVVFLLGAGVAGNLFLAVLPVVTQLRTEANFIAMVVMRPKSGRHDKDNGR